MTVAFFGLTQTLLLQALSSNRAARVSSKLSFAHPMTVDCSRMKLVQILIAVLVVLAVLAGGAFLYVQNLLSPTGAPKATLEVKPGMSVSVIASELERLRLVRSSDAFRLALRLIGGGRDIKEGLYDLDGTFSATEIGRALEKGGRPRVVKVTIPEGLRIIDVSARLEAGNFGVKSEFDRLFADSGLLEAAKGAKNLEGFIFPATYEFRPEDTPQIITKTMLDRFAQEASPGNLEKLRALKLTVFQWVTLASLVQAEAGNAAEMPVIAGVFLNRLETGITLGSDPTVAYGLGKKLPELSRPDGDFKKDTPYNTYMRQGLPLGPINNPGAAALEAVLNPARSSPSGKPWLYFLHGLNGEFRPNTDFQAHLRDTNRFR